MSGKGFKELLAEANAAIDTLSVEDALAMVDDDDVVLVDVRETDEHQRGAIRHSVHAPRGFLEFIVDPEGPMHNPALASGKHLVLYCGSGGRSALAAKTLKDMGVEKVSHIAGGFAAWQEAGGPTE